MKSWLQYLIALVVALLALAVAYGIPYSYLIDLGNISDVPFISGFNASEDTAKYHYRWSSDDSTLVFPGVAQGVPYQLELRLAAGARSENADVRISGNGKGLQSITVVPELKEYRVIIPASVLSSPDLLIGLQVPTFVPSNEIDGSTDNRALGVIVDWARLEPQSSPSAQITLPHPIYIFGWLLNGLIVFSILLQTGLAKRSWSLWFAFAVLMGALAVVLVLIRSFASISIWNGAAGLAFLLYISRGIPGWISKARARKRLPLEFLHTLGIASDRLRAAIEVLAVLTIATWFFVSAVWPLRTHALQDFIVYYSGATLFSQGKDYYNQALVLTTAKQVTGYGNDWPNFNNSPFTAMMFAPFTRTTLSDARLIWVLANFTFLAAGAGFLYYALRTASARSPSPIFLAAMLALSRPLRDSLGEGQVGALVFFLCAIAIWALATRRAIFAGAIVALATAVKIFPVLWLGYLLMKKSWRAFFSGVITGVVLLVITVSITGIPAWTNFILRVFPAYSEGMANKDNQSPNGFVQRLMPGAVLFGDYDPLDNPPNVPVRLVTTAMSLAFVALTVWRLRKNERPDKQQTVTEFGAVIALMLLAVPLVWEHYLMWLILPMYIILDGLANRVLETRWQIGLLLAFAASWYFLQDGPNYYATPNWPVLLMSLGLYATLMIFVSLLYLLARRIEES